MPIEMKFKTISAIFEMKKTIKLLKAGLAEIQIISPAIDFYDPAFMLLSSGIERLLKLMLLLHFADNNSHYPKSNEIWSNGKGHDLVSLKQEVAKICIPISQPFASIDYDIITNDIFINRVCALLSNYAKGGRYFNIDVILGDKPPFNPQDEWESLEKLPVHLC
jgi:hypothetical protein